MNTDDNSRPLLSIIVPVYNTAQYLSECLDSLCNQTLRDIEIICVNDGSTDDSLKILQRYERENSRITVIDQKNQGVSVARNNGVNVAKGKYLFFMDSDDLVDEHLAEYGIEFAEKNQCEVVNIRTLADCRQGVNIPYVRNLENQVRFQETQVCRNIFSSQREFFQYVSGGVPHNIVLKEAWKKYNLSFPTVIAINEDFFVWFLLYSQMKNVGFLFPKKKLFIRRWRPNSASITSSKKQGGGRCKAWDQFRVFDVLQRRFIEKKQFDSHRALTVRYLLSLYNLRFSVPRDERKFFKGEVDKIWNERITEIVTDKDVLPLYARYFWLGLCSSNRSERLKGRFVTFCFSMIRCVKETLKSTIKFILTLVPARYVSFLPVKLQRWHKDAPMSFSEF